MNMAENPVQEEMGLWDKLGCDCLANAQALLDTNYIDKDTARTVRDLVETAIAIDTLNLRWEELKLKEKQGPQGRIL